MNRSLRPRGLLSAVSAIRRRAARAQGYRSPDRPHHVAPQLQGDVFLRETSVVSLWIPNAAATMDAHNSNDPLTQELSTMNIYVGNLAYGTTDDDLRAAFSPYGAISSARVVFDKETGRSRGFGFVEMASQSEALAAIEALNQTELQGRQLRINEARPKR